YLINSWRALKARFQNPVGGECLNGIHTVDFDLRIATCRESEFPPTYKESIGRSDLRIVTENNMLTKH
ncbi:MAG: hypothetical protein OXI67_08590, partial [Candidatus Poribacteria bacterium]|nr:hypothetical protein [Candidatus Poribacteria bacterium]